MQARHGGNHGAGTSGTATPVGNHGTDATARENVTGMRYNEDIARVA
jgi:hypothetical protein